MTKMNGAQALIRSLHREGVRVVFGIPGAGQYDLIDSIYDEPGIRYISTRHEQATSYMADGYARVTGEVGTILVVPGPGLFNAAAGIATAHAASSPVLAITGGSGKISADDPDGEIGWMYPITKWMKRISSPGEAPAVVHEAFRQLTTGRPRPVAIEIDRFTQAGEADVDLLERERYPPVQAEDEAVTRCVNGTCPAQFERLLEHFASRGALDIEGLGERVAQDLVRLSFVSNIADIYRLHERRDDLLELEKMGEKRVDNLLAAIESSRSQPLPRLLFALGIPGIGSESAEWLSRRFHSLAGLKGASEEELLAIDGIGPVIASTLVDYFALEQNRNLINDLIDLEVNPFDDTPEPSADHPANGVTFVVTGRLESMSRSEAQSRIKALGGKATGTVTKKTDYLVAGADAGSKLEKANRLNIHVIDEDELVAFLEQGLVPAAPETVPPGE